MSYWTAIAAAANAGSSLLTNQENNALVRDMNAQNLAEQRRINDQNMQLQRDMNAFNDPAAQAQRMRQAGFNLSFAGDQVTPGNQTTMPSLGAYQGTPFQAQPPDFSLLANVGLNAASEADSKAAREKIRAEVDNMRFQLAIDKMFKEPEMQKMLRQMDADWQKTGEEINQIKEMVKLGQTQNALEAIKLRYEDRRQQYDVEHLKKQLDIDDATFENIVADTCLKAITEKRVNAEYLYQTFINEFRDKYKATFLASQLPDGMAGVIALSLDMLGIEPGQIQNFLTEWKNAIKEGGLFRVNFGKGK